MAEKDIFTKEELRNRLDGKELDLSLCQIAKVPVRQILSLPNKISVIDLSCNQIAELPDSFCELQSLTQIDLSKNCLVSLPMNFGSLGNLKRLDLYSNNLVSLPLSFSELQNLKWLDLKDNPVQDDLFDIVGDCLEQKDCENCATKMLNFMAMMKSEDDKRKMKEAVRERQMKVKEESEMKQLNELRRREKKEEKDKRRQAFLDTQKDNANKDDIKPSQSINGTHAAVEGSPKSDTEHEKSSFIIKLIKLLIFAAMVGLVVYLSTSKSELEKVL